MKDSVYANYPEQPYISKDRDIKDWLKNPEKYPYAKVERQQMVRLKEGLLPGDIIMLWRIGFNNFSTESQIPAYFEYRYGVDANASIQLLLKLKVATKNTARESLDLLSIPLLKKILKANNLKASGLKQQLLDRANQLSDSVLDASFDIRRYQITEKGKKLLKKYESIILKHGVKKY